MVSLEGRKQLTDEATNGFLGRISTYTVRAPDESLGKRKRAQTEQDQYDPLCPAESPNRLLEPLWRRRLMAPARPCAGGWGRGVRGLHAAFSALCTP